VAVALLLAREGATSQSPLRLRVLTRGLSLAPGGEVRVTASLTNTGKTTLRFEQGSGLHYLVFCRRPIDPPGKWGMATGSSIQGGVYGGRADAVPDPTDPYDCRSNPPKTFMLPAGESLPLTVVVGTPSRCVEGEAEVHFTFVGQDYGRKCPGIWYGEMGQTVRPATIRRRGTRGASPAGVSPASLTCALSTLAAEDGPSLQLTLRNPTNTAWRALAVPSLELVSEREAGILYWAPFRLSGPPAPLQADEADRIDLPPQGELSRVVKLRALAWSEDYAAGWPAAPLQTLPAGWYHVQMRMEILGGKSWEFRCGAASFELPSP